MKVEELERALDLQKRSYALLLWIGQSASRLLDQQALGSWSSCVDWLKHHWNDFPVELRPGLAELDAFAKMLTSFFTTSFHVDVKNGKARLVRGQKFKNGQSKKHAAGKTAETAAELSLMAIASLAETEGILLENDVSAAILNDEATSQALSLWSYGCELARRSQFASQGPAVHHLWKEVDEKKKKHLSAEDIWKARSVLIEALKKENKRHEQQTNDSSHGRSDRVSPGAR
jgi:hypothetical protein